MRLKIIVQNNRLYARACLRYCCLVCAPKNRLCSLWIWWFRRCLFHGYVISYV